MRLAEIAHINPEFTKYQLSRMSQRELFEELHWIRENRGNQRTTDPEKIQKRKNFIGAYRYYIRRGEQDHTHRCGESWKSWSRGNMDDRFYDYTILPDNGQTDEEIEEIFEDVVFPEINSPYDCTGRPCTHYTYHNRTKAGIVMIHCWGLDY